MYHQYGMEFVKLRAKFENIVIVNYLGSAKMCLSGRVFNKVENIKFE